MNDIAVSARDFRLDINGLRAWAVVAVVLYHFGIPGFNGGFVGVDVFFVISGFLMTGIVVRGLKSGKGFSVIEFYMARARRILPALIALCATLLVLGWWILTPMEYRQLSSHVIASLAFLSNFKFWREAGYFDASSHEKWLLHTWSLAAEWQFYLMLPLVLMLVWKLRPTSRAITVTIGATLLASLGLSAWLTPLIPTAAFYLLPTRSWEMLAGGLVYMLAHRMALSASQRTIAESLGFILIIGAIICFNGAMNWPGILAMVPVIGSMLVLFAAQSRSIFTGNALVQWLGTRSYSIYLWHWPLVVALTYMSKQADPVAISASLVLTGILGHVSYQWVETPARRHLTKLRFSQGSLAIICSTALVVSAGAAVFIKKGIPGRLAPQIELAANEATNKNPRQDPCFTKGGTTSVACIYGGERLRAVLIGDSHADAVTTALAAAVPGKQDGIMDLTYVSCLTAYGVKNLSPRFGRDEKCGDYLVWLQQKLKEIPKDVPLVIVNRTSVYAFGHNEPWIADANQPAIYFSKPYVTTTPEFLAEFAQRVTGTACDLAKSHPVYMTRPTPELGINVPSTIARSMVFGLNNDASISLDEYHNRNKVVWDAQDAARDTCGVKILNPVPYLCQDGRCSGTKNQRPLYYDDNHLSEFGNKLLVPMFATIFKEHPAAGDNLKK